MNLRARRRSLLAPSPAWLVALALGASPLVRAQSGSGLPTGPVSGKPDGRGPRDYPDGGTIRANSVLIPDQIREERAPEPVPKVSLLSLGSPDVLAALGPVRPETGAWAEYVLRNSGLVVGHVMVSVLPPPMPDGSFWMEIDAMQVGEIPAGIRMLSHGDPMVRGNLERVILSFGGQAMYEVPPQSLDEQRKNVKKVGDSGAQITTTPGIQVKVGKGTYSCDKIRIAKGKEVTQIWRSAEVPLFGLVRSESGTRVTELVGSGHTGGHTLIPVPILDEAIPPDAMTPPVSAQPGGPGSPSRSV